MSGSSKATGILLSDQSIVVSKAKKAGRRDATFETEEHATPEEGLAEQLRGLVAEKKLTGRVVLGVDLAQDYFITREIDFRQEDAPAEELLGFSPDRFRGGVAAEKIRVRLGDGATYFTLIASPKQTVMEAYDGLEALPAARVIITDCARALYALASKQEPRPKSWRTEVRILLGAPMGLALLVHDKQLVARRLFNIREGEEAGAVVGALAGLAAYASENFKLESIDGAVLHVGSERSSLVKACEEGAGVAIQAGPELVYSRSTMSQALARVAQEKPKPGVRLYSQIRPQTSLKETFPKLATAAAIVTLIGSSGVIKVSQIDLADKLSTMHETAESVALSLDVGVLELPEQSQLLEEEVSLAQSVIGDRVYWHQILEELPVLLPSTMTMVRLEGRDQVIMQSSAGEEEGVEIRRDVHAMITCTVPVSDGDTSPPEVPLLTTALRSSEQFGAHFPSISSARVQLHKDTGGGQAEVVVLCLPKGR